MELDQNVVVHGVRERTVLSSPEDFVKESLQRRGYAVIKSSFGASFIRELSSAIDASYDAQCTLHGGEKI